MSTTAVTPPAQSKFRSNLETLAPISAACAITAVAMYPVDVARALKMASAGAGPGYSMRDFIKTHGIKGAMSQGVLPEVIRATWMRVLKFFFFPITHEAMWNKPTSKGSPLEKGLAGAVAVIPEVFTITTLELAKIGLQTDKTNAYKNSISRLTSSVHAKYGFNGVMAGWQGVQMRQSMWTGVYFATLDSFKRLCSVPLNGAKPTPTEANLINFGAGFLAGVAGAICNTPIDVVRTNIQKELLSGNLRASPASYAWNPAMVTTLGREIVMAKGWSALYSGFTMKALHMGGSGAFVALLIPVLAKLMGIQKSIM